MSNDRTMTQHISSLIPFLTFFLGLTIGASVIYWGTARNSVKDRTEETQMPSPPPKLKPKVAEPPGARHKVSLTYSKPLVPKPPVKPTEPAKPAVPSKPQTEYERQCQEILNLPDVGMRMARLRLHLEGMTGAEAPEVLKLIKAQDGLGRQAVPEFELFLKQWGAADPVGMLAWAKERPTKEGADYVVRRAMEGWAKVAPEAAVKWLNEHPDSTHWEATVETFVKAHGNKDPWAAMKVARECLPTKQAAAVMGSLTESVARLAGAEGLIYWFEQQPATSPSDIKLKEEALQRVGERLLKALDQDAEAWLAKLPPEPWRSPEIYAQAANKMAALDPITALDWIASLPGQESKLGWEASKQIYHDLSKKSPEIAKAWLEKHPGPLAKSLVGQKPLPDSRQ